MSRKRSLQIAVPHPCSEFWELMSVAEKGRFCASCQKEVIDFASMTDKDILDFVAQYGTGFCGSFHESQLMRKITYPKQKSSIGFKKVAASILALITFKISNAQDAHISTKATSNILQLNEATNERKEEQTLVSYTISGRISTPGNNAADFAKVYIKIGNNETRYFPDSSGYFRVDVHEVMPYTVIAFYHPLYAREVRTISKIAFPATLQIDMDYPRTGRTSGAPMYFLMD